MTTISWYRQKRLAFYVDVVQTLLSVVALALTIARLATTRSERTRLDAWPVLAPLFGFLVFAYVHSVDRRPAWQHLQSARLTLTLYVVLTAAWLASVMLVLASMHRLKEVSGDAVLLLGILVCLLMTLLHITACIAGLHAVRYLSEASWGLDPYAHDGRTVEEARMSDMSSCAPRMASCDDGERLGTEFI